MYNPALREYPRHRPSPVIPQQTESSILDWLEGSNRLLARDEDDFDYSSDNEAEITELMSGDDSSFDDTDDDDALELDD
jgi:hypothetical protein